MKNPSRERMQAELVFLREQTACLELEIESLRGNTHRTYDNTELVKMPVSCMEALQKRRAAERENRQLRAALWRQLQMGRQLSSALTGHGGAFMELLGWNDPMSENMVLTTASPVHGETGFRFAQLTDEIDRAFAEVDAIFQHDEPVNQQPVTMLNSRMIDGREQIVMELRDSMAIPFPLERCTYALWYAINNAPWASYSNGDSCTTGPETTCVRLESIQYLRGLPVCMLRTVVIRRFVEKHRTVIVWRCITSLDGEEDLADVYMDETGWVVLFPVANDCGEEESVVKKKCVQWIPRSEEVHGPEAVVTNPHTGSFTNLVLSVTTADSSSITDMMENLLIQDCMTAHTGLPSMYIDTNSINCS